MHDIVRIFCIIFSAISVISSTLAVIIYVGLWYSKYSLPTRITSRLVVTACFVNIFYSSLHLGLHIYILSGKVDTASFNIACEVGAALSSFCTLYSILLLSMISLHLQLHFMHGWSFEDHHGIRAFCLLNGVAYMVGFSLVMTGWFTDSFGWDGDFCQFRPVTSSPSAITRAWLLQHTWVTLAIVYNLAVFLMVMGKIIFQQRQVTKQLENARRDSISSMKEADLKILVRSKTQKRRSQKLVISTFGRVVLYPLVPFLSQIFVIVEAMVAMTGTFGIGGISAMALLMASLQGFFIFLVFVNDSAVRMFYQEWKLKRKRSEVTRAVTISSKSSRKTTEAEEEEA